MGGLTVRKKGRDTIFFGGRNCRESFSARNGGIACRKPLGNAELTALLLDENWACAARWVTPSVVDQTARLT